MLHALSRFRRKKMLFGDNVYCDISGYTVTITNLQGLTGKLNRVTSQIQ